MAGKNGIKHKQSRLSKDPGIWVQILLLFCLIICGILVKKNLNNKESLVLFWFFFSITILITVFLMVVPFLKNKSFSVFFRTLSDEAQRIQRFDFSGKFPEIPRHVKNTEIKLLASSFCLMKETVQSRMTSLENSLKKLERIVDLSVAMSVESDSDRLIELILKGAKELSHADGGSLYLKGENKTLDFKIVLNDSLNIYQGGVSNNPVSMPPVALLGKDGEPNFHNVVTYAFHTGKMISIDDAYKEDNFDFSGTRKFDQLSGYRSQSFLTIPLTLQGSEVVGALQLINCISPETGEVVPFSKDIQGFVEALSAEAAAVINNRNLLIAQNKLFESLIHLMAGAIDTKSPYTGGHCARVPELALMLAREADKTKVGPLSDFHFKSSDDWKAFRIGAWLHDTGKVTTPEFVVDKSVKLETLYNRIHEIRTRFEVLLRDVWLEEKESLLAGKDPGQAEEMKQKKEKELLDDFSFVAECNIGSEEMDISRIKRLESISKRRWFRTFDSSKGLSQGEKDLFIQSGENAKPGYEYLLADKPGHIIPFAKNHNWELYQEYGFIIPPMDCLYNRGELYNLSIKRGTLTKEERFKINEHIMQTIVMLDQLPFPDSLSLVTEYAGTHHETLDGKGYPRGLTEDQLSIPARIMAIADIFEALTASDRPYKKAKNLSEALRILYLFKKQRHIDADLFNLFLSSGVYLDYAKHFLAPEQIDEVDINPYLD